MKYHLTLFFSFIISFRNSWMNVPNSVSMHTLSYLCTTCYSMLSSWWEQGYIFGFCSAGSVIYNTYVPECQKGEILVSLVPVKAIFRLVFVGGLKQKSYLLFLLVRSNITILFFKGIGSWLIMFFFFLSFP